MTQLSDLHQLEQRYAQLRLEELLTRATGFRLGRQLDDGTRVMTPANADALLSAIEQAAGDAAFEKEAALQRLIAMRTALRRAA